MSHMTEFRRSMKVFVRRLLTGLCIIMMFFVITPLQADAGAPLDTIQRQVDRLLGVLRDPNFRALPTEKEKTDAQQDGVKIYRNKQHRQQRKDHDTRQEPDYRIGDVSV